MDKCDIGLIGLAVMGQNLALNMERCGCRVSVYNRTVKRMTEFIEGPAAGKNIFGASSLRELIDSLEQPRKLLLMVKAGSSMDSVISRISGYMEPGDILIDGGNSHFKDTERRSKALSVDGIHYLGTGVSGGEEGALKGPSIMPGGPKEAYEQLRPLFEAVSAKVDSEPCVTYIGPRGAGHFVKMVHNGIEYGDMQLIAEAYDLLYRGKGLPASEISELFERWNRGPLSSYLIEITSSILKKIDPETGRPLVESILDTAEQKGTGRWSSQIAMDLGVPTPTIDAAVQARILSAYKKERERAAQAFPQGSMRMDEPDDFADAVEEALYTAKICSYAQGMDLLRRADREYDYSLNFSEIARIWRGGCIIRARFLDDIRAAYAGEPDLPNLLLAPFFLQAVRKGEPSLRRIVAAAVRAGIPVPAMGASLAYYDAYRSLRLPANLIQAQRDYFGAHTYRRIDREGLFHTEWEKM